MTDILNFFVFFRVILNIYAHFDVSYNHYMKKTIEKNTWTMFHLIHIIIYQLYNPYRKALVIYLLLRIS